jgi:5-formyltetrahydrofolate cyclo-ligase
MTGDADNAKRALRAELRERRRIATSRTRESADSAISGHLVDLATRLGVSSISAYLSTPDEPDTREFLAWACKRDIRVLLPISREDGLLDWATFDGSEEAADHLGMPTPTTEVLGPIAINDVDLIIVPAAAVDVTGMRMGWGRGYFDKTLGSMEKRPPVYAVIFDNELLDSVPREVHDQPVDGVVAPSGITSFDSATP